MKIRINKKDRIVKCPPGTWSSSPSFMVLDENGYLSEVYVDDEMDIETTLGALDAS